MKEQPWCAWHVIHIEDPDEEGERSYTVLHPEGECPLSVSSRGIVSYECWIGWEILNSGWIGYFDPKSEKVSPGWYRVRGRNYELRVGLNSPEVDVETEVDPIDWVEVKTEVEVQHA